jgi:hypothetical protein
MRSREGCFFLPVSQREISAQEAATPALPVSSESSPEIRVRFLVVCRKTRWRDPGVAEDANEGRHALCCDVERLEFEIAYENPNVPGRENDAIIFMPCCYFTHTGYIHH